MHPKGQVEYISLHETRTASGLATSSRHTRARWGPNRHPQLHHGCPNRNECPIEAYGFAEADRHNLWPAIGAINSSRGDKLFGEIPGNKRTLPPGVSDLKCDYERTTGADAVVEPRDAVKEEIARSLFYMHVEYGLELKGMLPMLKGWNAGDPPKSPERARNTRIEALQSMRNRFIDDPKLAEQLK